MPSARAKCIQEVTDDVNSGRITSFSQWPELMEQYPAHAATREGQECLPALYGNDEQLDSGGEEDDGDEEDGDDDGEEDDDDDDDDMGGGGGATGRAAAVAGDAGGGSSGDDA